MHILDSLCKFTTEKLIPTVKDAAVPISKRVFCSVASTKMKKELIIKRIRNMSEGELDEVMKNNHPLGFIGAHIYSRESKLEKIIDAVNKMNDSEINELIINS